MDICIKNIWYMSIFQIKRHKIFYFMPFLVLYIEISIF
jgi:hypothetical protein